MVNNWDEVQLGDVSSDVSYGYTESATNEEVGPKFLRITDIQNGVVNWNTVPYCPIEDSKLKKYLLHKGDIVVARTGNSTGENYIFTGEQNTVYASYLIRFRIKEDVANPFFVWYSMRSPHWWAFIQGAKTGSAQAGANAKVLSSYSLKLPPIPEQKAIAHILGTLDDKIELNRQMNETLEAMAQALFKSWFVDFDPVIDNALLAGKAIPEPLKERAEMRQAQLDSGKIKTNSEINDLFPSEFEFTEELGWIPKGWSVKSANEVANISIGKTPPRKQQEHFSKTKEDNFIWVSIRDMGENSVFIHDSSEYLTKNSVVKFNVKVVPKDSVILSFKLTLGRVLIADVDVTTNEAIAHFINPKFSMTKEYIYSYLKLFNYQLLGSTSSIATAVNSKIIKAIPFLVPHEDVLNHFKSESKDYFEKIRLNSLNTQTLAELRDTLLPKLMSGELRIADAEKLAENI